MLQLAVDGLLYAVLGLPREALWAQALNFFLYDSVKILILLFGMIAVIGFLRTYCPQEKIKGCWHTQKAGDISSQLFSARSLLFVPAPRSPFF